MLSCFISSPLNFDFVLKMFNNDVYKVTNGAKGKTVCEEMFIFCILNVVHVDVLAI